MIKLKHYLALGLLLGLPLTAFGAVTNILGLEVYALTVLNALANLFLVMAVAFFIWGVVKFIANYDDPTKHEEGKKFLVWGVISFLVIVSIWGIVRYLLVDTLGIMPGAINVVFIDKDGNPV